jgi:predicted dehydrogenase
MGVLVNTGFDPYARKIRYAVVGVGWISQAAFLPGVEHTENSEVVALVTSDEFKAQKVGELYGIKKTCTYAEYGELLASGEIDAVYLATPNVDHVELAVRTLEAGIHLLLEKPMAVSVAECERIIAASKKSGAKLMIAYRLHHEPGTLSALEVVRSHKLGKVRFFNSSFSQQVSGLNHRAKNGFWAGPVTDMGPYPLNAVRNLFGAEPIEVFATGVISDPQRFDFEDTVSVTLKFEDARMATFTVSYTGGDVDDYRVVGELGDIFVQPAYQVGSKIEYTTTIAKKKSHEGFPKTDHFGGELKYFSDCIRYNREPEADGEEGMLDVRVFEAIERSLRTGEVQRLAPYYRSKRPIPSQVEELYAVSEPSLVHASKPSDGR